MEQKRKIDDEERKKNDKHRDIIEQNARNLEERRRQEEEAKERERIKNQPKPQPVPQSKEMYSRQAQYQPQSDDTTSEVSEETVLQKAFDTGISKQFFENERRKDQ